MDEEQRNLFLAIVLSALVLGVSMYFNAPPAQHEDDGTAPKIEQNVSDHAPPAENERPRVEPTKPLEVDTSPTEAVSRDRDVAEPAETRHRVQEPLFDVEFSTRGAAISHWWLNTYRTLEDQPIELTTTEGSDPPIALAMPLTDLGVGDFDQTVFDFNQVGAQEFVFTAQRGGIRVQKRYRFNPESYLFDFDVEIQNRSAAPVRSALAIYWPTEQRTDNDFSGQELIAFHLDKLEKQRLAAVGKPGLFARFSGKKEGDEKAFLGDVAWAGEQTRYFLSVILPETAKETHARFLRAENGNGAVTEVSRQPVEIAAGSALSAHYRVFVGPKEPHRLRALGYELSRTTDMGWAFIRPIVRGFRWALLSLNRVFHNFGLSIIVVTILLKLVTAPLTTKQMNSMRRMGELKPQLDALKEKFGDDRQAFGQAQMELYRKEGVNPLGGCLPMVAQFPVFIGLYYALQSTIELRHAPFFGWITDLSAPEVLFDLPVVGFPLRVLPLIMGVSMLVQQRMTPTPSMDPAQARMMRTVMPLMMTVMFYQFPSGLVLYWLMNNLLTIAHTAWVQREKFAAA